jgi:predicted site-specific integrase-resolvase
MKLSEYARKNSLTYRTAQNHWKAGFIKGKQLPSGTIVVFDDQEEKSEEKGVIIYARVSSSENKKNLNEQLKRLRDFSSAKGYKIIKEVKEIGSGLNDKRQQLEQILKRDDWNKLIVEHKDRLARFGINYIEVLLSKQGKYIEVINETDTAKDDLMQDFVSIITSFTARLYGLRRSRRKTEKMIKELKNEKKK